MKESNCHNSKMPAYCQEVCKLEDKFDDLELNHIPRRLNEAADKLAKMVSSQELVPVSIFTSDQQ
jgi:ribonuclease HI